MFLTSLLLSVITFHPAFGAASAGPTQGYVSAQAISPDKACKPGDICAMQTFKHNGCFFNNFANSANGGTPLAIDVTQTGAEGSIVYIYWVNNTNQNVGLKNGAVAKFYCPKT